MSQVALEDGTMEQLRTTIGGDVIAPDDEAYDEARRVWNGMIDCHPALVVRCASTADVAAGGEVVKASADENVDLFWGLRGGGGNFGVVTEFEFRVHPVGPIITGGMLLYPRARAKEVLRFYRDFIAEGPDQVGGGAALITAPPEDFIPEELRGQPALVIVFSYIGSIEDGEEAVRPLRESTGPVVDIVQPMPYVALQQMLDAGNPRGVREYFKVDWL